MTLPLEFTSRPKPYIMAHRGNRSVCPENTLVAFQRAFAEEADILETDLRRTADGVFVCIHDETVNRTTDGHGYVAEKTLAELKMLDAGFGHLQYAGQRIPTLAELACILPAATFLALELKSDDFLQPAVCRTLAAELSKLGIAERTVFVSFSLPRLHTMQAAVPGVRAGWITIKGLFPARGMQMAGPYWPLLLANPLFVLIAHLRRQVVCPLDPTPEPRLWLYRLLGCDAVLTDDPGKTRRALTTS